jgi:hypothetical protein
MESSRDRFKCGFYVRTREGLIPVTTRARVKVYQTNIYQQAQRPKITIRRFAGCEGANTENPAVEMVPMAGNANRAGTARVTVPFSLPKKSGEGRPIRARGSPTYW